MEGGRLSQPRHCSKDVQPMPKVVYRSSSRNKHNCLRPLTPQSFMLPLNHCDLQRHVGVNNLPESNAVTTTEPATVCMLLTCAQHKILSYCNSVNNHLYGHYTGEAVLASTPR